VVNELARALLSFKQPIRPCNSTECSQFSYRVPVGLIQKLLLIRMSWFLNTVFYNIVCLKGSHR